MQPKTIITVQDATEKFRSLSKAGHRIALVPTMGALHEGHLSLVKKAKEHADIVIVSIFVNPTQFGPSEDFAKYPRTLKKDLQLLEAMEVDYVFAPTANELYPSQFQTWTDNDGTSNQLCGASRSGHFKGVCTIVLKLFNIVRPDFAVFGKKDYQQLAVIKSMVRDLNLDVQVLGGEIIREPDGLAMSSRNTYLSDEDRNTALLLSHALNAAKELFAQGERSTMSIMNVASEVIQAHKQIELEYCEVRDQVFLQEFADTITAPCVLLIAAKVAQVRLIDNIELGTYEFV